MKFIRRLSACTAIAVIAVLNMGNEGCQNDEGIQKPPTRMLRRSVEVRDLAIQNIQVPEGQTFDFRSVVKWQMQSLLNQTERYLITINDPPPSGAVNQSSEMMKASAINPDSTLTAMSLPDQDGERYWQSRESENVMELSSGEGLLKTASFEENPHWPSCLQNKAHLIFRSQINSFVLTDQGGVQIGYNQGGVLPTTGVNVNFQTRSASLDMGLQASDGTWGWLLASGQAASSETQTTINAMINLGLLAMNANYFFQTKLVDVTASAITMSLNRLNKQMDDMQKSLDLPSWEGRVLPGQFPQTHVLINAGRLHGIKAGDRFYIHNVLTVWDGPICDSKLLRRELSLTPEAIVEVGNGVSEIGENYTYARIVEGRPNHVLAGASVLIQSLKQEEKTEKK